LRRKKTPKLEASRQRGLGANRAGAPPRERTPASRASVANAILGFDAELYVEGHHESVSSRAEIESLIAKMRFAEKAVREGSATTAQDQDTDYFVEAFRAGRRQE
jgi:hypothetical protein